MNTKALRGSLFTIIGLISLAGSLAQAKVTAKIATVENGRLQQKHAKYAWLKNWAWTSEEWTGNDVPYSQIQTNVDQIFADGNNLDSYLQAYQKKAELKPMDARSQFRWGYLALRMANNTDYDLGEKILDPVRDALANAPSPHTYSYSRLRFLTATYMLPFPKLKDLGERLLNRKPTDYDAKYSLTFILACSPSADEQQQSLKYAQELVQASPKKPEVYSLLGSFYYIQWQRHHMKADEDNAVSAYQRYLDLAPQNYGFRRQASHLIQILKKA